MPCGCNSICDNDCNSNQLCTGHVPACSNSFTFSSISVGALIRASELRELETAINQERVDSGRRFNASNPAYCNTHTPGDLACTNNDFSATVFNGGEIGDAVKASDYNDVKNSNNTVVSNSGFGGSITATFVTNGLIKAIDIQEIQTKINQTRNVCICDSHCNCDPSDCGCNGECPSDDYYYF